MNLHDRMNEAARNSGEPHLSELHIVELLRDFGEHARANPLCRVMDRAEIICEAADPLDELYDACETLLLAYTGDWVNCERAVLAATATIERARSAGVKAR